LKSVASFILFLREALAEIFANQESHAIDLVTVWFESNVSKESEDEEEEDKTKVVAKKRNWTKMNLKMHQEVYKATME